MFSVTTANTDRLLLTRAEIGAVVSETDTVKLDALNARVSAMITKACKVVYAGATPPTLRLEAVQDTYRLKNRSQCLFLSRKPVVTISSLVEDSVTLDKDVDFEVETSSGILYRLSGDARDCWSATLITVAYTAGWQTVPYDLRELACKLATMISSESGQNASLGSMDIPGVIAETYRFGRPDDPLIPAEIMEGLRAGGYVNTWVA